MSEKKKKKKSLLSELDEEITKQVMDQIPDLFKYGAVRFSPAERGLNIAVNPSKLKNSAPDITDKNLTNVIRFIATYVHFITCHDTDAFYDGFKEDKKKAETLCTIVKGHKNFDLMLFRCLRMTNFIEGRLESTKRSIIFKDDKKYTTDYYDIRFPLINEKGDEVSLRMELDTIELEDLISSLAEILERGTKK